MMFGTFTMDHNHNIDGSEGLFGFDVGLIQHNTVELYHALARVVKTSIHITTVRAIHLAIYDTPPVKSTSLNNILSPDDLQ